MISFSFLFGSALGFLSSSSPRIVSSVILHLSHLQFVAVADEQLLLLEPLTHLLPRLRRRRGIRLSAMRYLSPAHLRRRRRRRAGGGRDTLTCSRSLPLLLLASFFRSLILRVWTASSSSSSSWAVRSSFPVPPLPPLASPFTYSPSPSSVRAPHRSVRAWSTYIFTIHP